MKKFNVLRYLKKFSILILIFAIVGTSATVWYVNKNQKYTANVTIRYKSSNISSGLAPDGTKFDAKEIYSAPVITKAMEIMGSNGPINIIRSRCGVEEIITEDQKKINDAILDKGEEVTYHPDKYKISIVVDNNFGSEYARTALEAIVQSYCTYYTEKYVERPLSINPTSNLVKDGYEYYQCVSILEDDTEEMIEYLKSKKNDYPEFRSSKTGYSYSDLYEKYCQLRDYYIPELYCSVLTGPQIKDGNILREYIANQIANSQINEGNLSKNHDLIKALIDDFVEQNKNIAGGTIESDEEYEQGILHQIEHNGDTNNSITTYDNLILKLVSIDKRVADEQIDREFYKEILAAFGKIGSGSSGTEKEHKKVERLINNYENKLLESYEIVKETSKELNSSLSSEYLETTSSVHVYQSINSKLYVSLAVILFLIVGGVGAVVLGRFGDYLSFLVYIDKKTNLPNRDKINEFVDVASKKLLSENYTCISVTFDNLSEITGKFGYSIGDSVLLDFSKIVGLMANNGFVGYNGSGSYLAFIDNCHSKRAEAILSVIEQQVSEYNRNNPDCSIAYRASFANSSDDGEYEIRNLLRLAIQRCNKKEEETV